jgi:hypothetical protein
MQGTYGRSHSLYYCEPLITQQMKASGSPFGVKIDAIMVFKTASIKDYKDSHQFSCKIQVTY